MSILTGCIAIFVCSGRVGSPRTVRGYQNNDVTHMPARYRAYHICGLIRSHPPVISPRPKLIQ